MPQDIQEPDTYTVPETPEDTGVPSTSTSGQAPQATNGTSQHTLGQRKWKTLSDVERATIRALRAKGTALTAIAGILGRDYSTVQRYAYSAKEIISSQVPEICRDLATARRAAAKRGDAKPCFDSLIHIGELDPIEGKGSAVGLAIMIGQAPAGLSAPEGAKVPSITASADTRLLDVIDTTAVRSDDVS